MKKFFAILFAAVSLAACNSAGTDSEIVDLSSTTTTMSDENTTMSERLPLQLIPLPTVTWFTGIKK